MFAQKYERRDFMYTDGFLKISRKILDWRWYTNSNTMRVFLHLMLRANHTDAEFENYKVKRGQLVTSRKALAYELKMSEQSVRTALNHLKSTHDITITTTKKYSIITIVDYELLQINNQPFDQRKTNERPTANQQLTNNQPQYNKDKKYNKYNKNNNAINNDETEISESVKVFNSHSLFDD